MLNPSKSNVLSIQSGFQNIIFDSKNFPGALRERVYQDLHQAHGQEKKPGDTDKQFLYKSRKQSFGVFKRDLWHLPEETLRLWGELEKQFAFLFQKLNMVNTGETVHRYVKPRQVTIAPT